MEKSQKERCGNNNLLMIKDDFSKKKEKFENIQKKYILNKSNQLIDSLSDNNASTNNENNDDNNYGKNFIDEYFKENDNYSDLSQRYLYNDNFLFICKKMRQKLCSKIKNGIKKIPQKIKYLIILILLMISLIFCVFGLYNSIINNAK